MTIASEIQRLQWAKADMQISIGNKWVTVPSTAKLDEYAWYIDQIQQGSSSGLIYYFTGILSISSNMVNIGSHDHVEEKYSDYSWIDGTNLYLVRPYEYYDYSSSWHSYYKTYASCICLPKWASSSIKANIQMCQWGDYTYTYIDYYYLLWPDIKFYIRITGGNYPIYKCVTVTFSNWAWSVAESSWDGNRPSRTGGNQYQMHSTIVWTQGSWDSFLYNWKV